MEVLSSVIICVRVRSHNQGVLINHLSLNSNYQAVLLDWDGYSAKLPTKDIVGGQEVNLVSKTRGSKVLLSLLRPLTETFLDS